MRHGKIARRQRQERAAERSETASRSKPGIRRLVKDEKVDPQDILDAYKGALNPSIKAWLERKAHE